MLVVTRVQRVAKLQKQLYPNETKPDLQVFFVNQKSKMIGWTIESIDALKTRTCSTAPSPATFWAISKASFSNSTLSVISAN